MAGLLTLLLLLARGAFAAGTESFEPIAKTGWRLAVPESYAALSRVNGEKWYRSYVFVDRSRPKLKELPAAFFRVYWAKGAPCDADEDLRFAEDLQTGSVAGAKVRLYSFNAVGMRYSAELPGGCIHVKLDLAPESAGPITYTGETGAGPQLVRSARRTFLNIVKNLPPKSAKPPKKAPRKPAKKKR